MTHSHQSITVGVSAGAQGFADLRDEWQALADCLSGLNFVQCPQWAGGYLQCLTDAAQDLRWITVRRAGALVAVWPLQVVRHGWGPFAIRELTGLTHPHMTLSDIVADPADAAIWPQLWKWLETEARLEWDRLVLPRLAENCVLARWIAQRTPELMHSNATDGSAWLDCERSFDELLKAASANHRSSLSRGARRAEKIGDLRYETHNLPDGLAQALEHFMVLEASGWKGVQGGAVARKPELIAFYKGLTQALGARGQCEIDLLWLGPQPIATVFWFRTGGQLYLQKIAYREEFANLGPGKLIMAEALERACSDPSLLRVNFITRCPWADGWRTRITPVWRHSLYRSTLRGRVGSALIKALERFKAGVKPWVKRLRERSDALANQ
jgi:CelD/BcsL family acetyltransferase involved in cellulose biosynthesis